MNLLFTSDIHVDPLHTDRLIRAVESLRPRCVVIGGDLTPIRAKDLDVAAKIQGEWLEREFVPGIRTCREKFPETSFYLDCSNDDLMAARRVLEKYDGELFHLIHNRVLALDDSHALVGYMNVPPTPFRIKDWEKADCRDRTGLNPVSDRPGEKTDTGKARPYKVDPSQGTLEEDFDALSDILESPGWREKTVILAAHSPPLDTALDGIQGGIHVGSLAVRRFIERWAENGRLKVGFHGHIHESPNISGTVRERIRGVPCYNPGQTPGRLRALILDPDDPEQSARLVLAAEAVEQLSVS